MVYEIYSAIDDIVEAFSKKIDITKINDDNYIKSFINDNLHDEIMITIYNKLLSMSISENEEIINNNYCYTIYKTIQIYKKWFDYNELNDLIDNDDYLEYYIIKDNDIELKYYAKLALSLIYNDFMMNDRYNNYKNKILVYIKDYINNKSDDDNDDN